MTAPSQTFLDHTLEVWQPRASRRLTREDARQIAENLSGFFSLLLEWDTTEGNRRFESNQGPEKV